MKILVLFLALSLSAVSTHARNEKFGILTGEGVEVCEAYKRALEEIDFVRPPYCDRPVNPSAEWLEWECSGRPHAERCKNNVPLHSPEGFPPVRRNYLSGEEVFELFDRVSSFIRRGNQYTWEHTNGRDGTHIRTIDGVNLDMRLRRLVAWQTNPLPDVDNDGAPDNVLFWQRNRCSSDEYGAPRPLIVDEQLKKIDEVRTSELFSKSGSTLTPGQPFQFIRTENANAGGIGVFRYKGKFYIDAWERTYINDEKQTNLDLNVWLRENGQTRRVCGYHWIRNEGK